MADTFTPEQIAQILEEFFKVVGTRQYIGARYVPLFGRKDEESIEWDNTAPYEPLTIVLYQGNSYTSRQFVPVGVEITNQEFWAITGNYNAQVEMYRRETAAAKATAEEAQGTAAQAQEDIDTLLPKADFSAENTVKDYIDAIATNTAQIIGDNFSPEHSISDFENAAKLNDNKLAGMSVVNQGFQYQCRVSDDTYSAQAACYNENKIYVFMVNGNNDIKLVTIDVAGNTYSETNLATNAHANTVTIMPNKHVLLSANGDLYAYECDLDGAYVRSYDVPVADINICYDDTNDRYVGVSITNNMFYIFDNALNVIDTFAFDWQSVKIYNGQFAIQNCAMHDGVFYVATRPDAIYMFNIETKKMFDCFRLAHQDSSEFEGVAFIKNKPYAINHQYVERVTTINPIFMGSYFPYNGYNGETQRANYSSFGADDTTSYVNFNAENAICYGNQAYPFASITQAMERLSNRTRNMIYVTGTANKAINLSIAGQSVNIRAVNDENPPSIPSITVRGNGTITLYSIHIDAISGNGFVINNESHINANLFYCQIAAPNGTALIANNGSYVNIRSTCKINGNIAISAASSNIYLESASIVESGSIAHLRGSSVGDGIQLVSALTEDNFMTAMPLSLYRFVYGTMQIKVTGLNFAVPYIGIIIGNNLYCFGLRFASVTTQNESATYEGTIDGNSVTKAASTMESKIINMYGVC